MRVKTFELFAVEKEQVNWLVEDLIPDTGWFLLIGEQGIGKSTFVVQICAALANGSDFLGMKTKETKPLYIQADSPTKEWREAIRRISPKSKALTLIDVPTKCLENQKHVDDMSMCIDKFNPGFVVFDSLYNLTNVNINTDQVLRPITIMKEMCGDRPFLLIHHPKKEGTGVQGHSGHGSLSANSSIHFTLTRNKLKIEKGRLIDKKQWSFNRDESGLWIVDSGEEELLVNNPWLRSVL